MREIIQINKQFNDEISQACGLPTTDEMLGHPNEDLEYESQRDLEDEMKDYGLYIKSHSEVPDYEDEVRAFSIEEAAQKFWEKMGQTNQAEWSPEDLLRHIGELK